MRVLLDENFPMPLMKDFIGHECSHVISLGWEGVLNGELLAKAEEAGFEVLVTYDSHIPTENRLDKRAIAVIVVKPEGQGVAATRILAAEILAALQACEPGQVRTVTNRTGGAR